MEAISAHPQHQTAELHIYAHTQTQRIQDDATLGFIL